MSRKKGRLVVNPVNPPLVDIFSLADLQTVLNSNTSVTPAANKIPKADGSGKTNTGYLNASTAPAANTIPIADSNNKLNVNWLDFVQNFGTNGYCKLPNGLILQWGSFNTYPSGSYYIGTITFPIAFPNNVFTVVGISSTKLGGDFYNAGGQDILVLNIFTNTNFQFRLDSNVATGLSGLHPINWMAVGY